MDSVTTQEDVLRLAKSKRTDPKLKRIAKVWNLNYVQIYHEWYPLGCSRNFLILLVKLSGLTEDYSQGRQILLECKQQRTRKTEPSSSNWTLADAESAVKRAEKMLTANGPGWAHETESMAKDAHVTQSVDHGYTGTRTRKRSRWESEQNGTSVHSTGESTELARTTPAQRHSDAAGVLVESLQTRRHGRSRQTTALPHTTAPNRFPPTPSSAISTDLRPCSVDMPDNSRSSSSPLRPAQTPVDLTGGRVNGARVTNGAEPTRETHQVVPRDAAQPEWNNDDRLDILLRAFNPDPSMWYIVPTQMLEAGQAVSATRLEFKSARTLPKMALIPLCGADGAQRILIVFDRMRAHAFIFNAEGCDHAAKLAWSTAQSLLTKLKFLQGEASTELCPFPSMLPNEGVNSGIHLIVAALHKLHERPIESISPKLWRALLAGFFPDGRDPPQARFDKLLAGLTKLTCSEENEGVGIEQSIKDAESLPLAQTTVESYAGQARLLLQMTEAQLRGREERRKLAGFHEWLLAKPPDTEFFADEVAALETNVVSQLDTLPDISEWCERQLCSIETSCQHAVQVCEQTTIALEARRKAIVQTAEVKHKRLGVKLMALST